MAEGRRDMVLALNYELVSDATRALESMRRLEELTPDHQLTHSHRQKALLLRAQLTDLTMLPAIAGWRVTGRNADPERASAEEIDARYTEFLAQLDDTPQSITLDGATQRLEEANRAMEALQEVEQGSPEEIKAALERASRAIEALNPSRRDDRQK